ncbi:apolipoprotein N-acyltransferase [Ensifer soli]|uniref:apolipoprotein N-acyltransferase n=1 Tax=Ciceribacter sp. sgz301302 TaxID=3342379 RepID=UPI0035B838B2
MESLSGRLMLMSGGGRCLVGFLAGLLAVLALPPVDLFLAPFVSFTLLVFLIDGASGDPDGGALRRLLPSLLLGWAFGFGYFLGGLWWLGNALLVEAEDFAWALPLAVLGLPALLALYFAFAVTLARLLWSDGAGRIAALAFSFGLFEWLRGILLTGFPWNAVGHLAMPGPLLMQSVGLVGSLAMNTLAVFVFAAPALLVGGRKSRSLLALAALLLVAHVGYGIYTLQSAAPAAADPAVTVRLVQPVIDQSKKLDDGERASVFEAHLSLSAAAPPEGQPKPSIIIWPETAIPFILTENPSGLQRIADVLDEGQILIAGAVRAEDAGAGQVPRYYNSIYVIDDQGQIIGAADKVHLVPFGEYLPLASWLKALGLDAVAMPGGFSPAATRTPLTLPGGRTLYPLICYEAIFPNEIGDDAATATALLNVTNDAWFGRTPGPYQHFQQARLLAVETGLPLLRAANSGISAVLGGRGEVVDGLALDVKGYVDVAIPGRQALHFSGVPRNRIALAIGVILLLVAIFSRIGFIYKEN